uniref:Uncharacterized protein n=1 Tax=viral metagenome TaxID=1070528 RepID=A0A6C0C247_9ZZZZ
MAHDGKQLKAGIYLYDKLFRKETSMGSVIFNEEHTPVHEKNKLSRNINILNEISKIIHFKPNYTINQYNTYLHKHLPVCTYLRHFKDYSFSQPDLPIEKNLARDNYEKLWGIPKEVRSNKTNKFTGGLEQFSGTEKYYKKNLMRITMKTTKENPNASIKDLEKIIEAKYPIESELLLNYVKKFKHLMD